MKLTTAVKTAVILSGLLLCGAVATAGEICLQQQPLGDLYRLGYEQRGSTYAVNGMIARFDNYEVATTGTAFRDRNRVLTIALTTTYPNHFTHPQCTDVFIFQSGNFLTVNLEGTCFGGLLEPSAQYTASYKPVPCP